MGIDVNIYFASTDGNEPTDLYLPESIGNIEPYTGAGDATHEVNSLSRYYGIGYERGPWVQICGVLMSLFASTNVSKVWYCGDGYPDEHHPVTIDDVLKISRHYMENGERPYRAAFKMLTSEYI